RYMFEDLSVFKEPVPDGEDRPAHYEVLFNDHYITFTKRAATQKPTVDFNTNQEAKNKLVQFLQNIVHLDKERREKRELAKSHQIDVYLDSITDEKKVQIDEFIHMQYLNPVKQRATERDSSTYG